MRSAIKLFLVLVTIVVIIVSWITHQLDNPGIMLLIGVLLAISLTVFFVVNFLDHRDEKMRRQERESPSHSKSMGDPAKVKRAEGSFALKERKAGLTWGGGNIKASEATRGTKRKFLGR